MNLPICRLALFLDPRYKAAVESTDGLVGMYEKVRLFLFPFQTLQQVAFQKEDLVQDAAAATAAD